MSNLMKSTKAELVKMLSEKDKEIAELKEQILEPETIQILSRAAVQWGVQMRIHRIAFEKGQGTIQVHRPQQWERDLLKNFLEIEQVKSKSVECPDCNGSGWFDQMKAMICFSCVFGRDHASTVEELGIQTFLDVVGEQQFKTATGRTSNASSNQMQGQTPSTSQKEQEEKAPAKKTDGIPL